MMYDAERAIIKAQSLKFPYNKNSTQQRTGIFDVLCPSTLFVRLFHLFLSPRLLINGRLSLYTPVCGVLRDPLFFWSLQGVSPWSKSIHTRWTLEGLFLIRLHRLMYCVLLLHIEFKHWINNVDNTRIVYW